MNPEKKGESCGLLRPGHGCERNKPPSPRQFVYIQHSNQAAYHVNLSRRGRGSYLRQLTNFYIRERM